jgi:Zn-dependent protease
MRHTIPLGRVAGIRIGAHWSALVTVVLFGWLLGADLHAAVPHASRAGTGAAAILGALAFIGALLAHELAHCLAARRCGLQVESVTLWALGGVSELREAPRTARADFWIAVAGPATSMGAGVLFGALAVAAHAAGGGRVAVAVLVWLAVMNVLLGVFNLLPGAPLDGGRILRAALWRHHGDRARAAGQAANAGRILGFAIAMGGIAEIVFLRSAGGLWLVLVGMFVSGAAGAEGAEGAEGRAGAAGGAAGGLRVEDVMTPAPAVGGAWMSVADFFEQVASRSEQAEFPVVAPDLSLAGVTGLDRLARIPGGLRATVTLAETLTPVPEERILAPGDPAIQVLGRAPLLGDLLAVVIEDRRIVGIVTATQFELITRHQVAGAPGAPGRGGEPA